MPATPHLVQLCARGQRSDGFLQLRPRGQRSDGRRDGFLQFHPCGQRGDSRRDGFMQFHPRGQRSDSRREGFMQLLPRRQGWQILLDPHDSGVDVFDRVGQGVVVHRADTPAERVDSARRDPTIVGRWQGTYRVKLEMQECRNAGMQKGRKAERHEGRKARGTKARCRNPTARVENSRFRGCRDCGSGSKSPPRPAARR